MSGLVFANHGSCKGRRAQNWPGCRLQVPGQTETSGEVSPKKKSTGPVKEHFSPAKQGHTSWKSARSLHTCPSPTRNGTRYSFLCEQRLASGPQQMRIVYSLARLWIITSAAAGLHVSFPTGSPFLSFWRGDAASFDKPSQLQQFASHSASGHWRRACPLEQKQKTHMHRFWGEHGTGTWEYYSTLRPSRSGSLRGHGVQEIKLGLKQPAKRYQCDSTPSGTSPFCFFEPLCCPRPTAMHNATRTQRQMLDRDLATCCQAAAPLRLSGFICCAPTGFCSIGLRTACVLGAGKERCGLCMLR